MQENRNDLKIDWCDFKAAEYACKNWHYSKCMPAGKTVKVGAWENGKYIGCVIFSRGANVNLGTQFGLKQDRICELTRVALTNHKHFVSEILAKAIKFLKNKCPDLYVIISYADTEQNHKGGIYQATNWIYLGRTAGERYFILNGKKTHPKSIHSKYGKGSQSLTFLKKIDSNASEYYTKGKHKYAFPLNKRVKKELEKIKQEYPKRFDEGAVIRKYEKLDLN